MQLSDFRTRLQNKTIDNIKFNQIVNEYENFKNIAPKTHFDFITKNPTIASIGNTFKTKYNNFKNASIIIKILTIILILLVCPIILLLSLVFPIFPICILIIGIMALHTPSALKNYDFNNNIVLPTLHLLDDKLNLNFTYNSQDLVDTDMHYIDALVQAHMIKPIKTSHGCYGDEHSSCSYDWENSQNTDSFQFSGYRIYSEWTDSDDKTHTEDFFNGLVFKFHTSFTINGTIDIMPTYTTKNTLGIEKETNNFQKIHNKNEHIIDTENKEFADYFDTLATYDEEAYKFLTPLMIESLLNLRKDYYFSIFIKGNVLTITIFQDNYNHFKLNNYTFYKHKPRIKPTETSKDCVESMYESFNNGILSIYQLKDILDPKGKFSNDLDIIDKNIPNNMNNNNIANDMAINNNIITNEVQNNETIDENDNQNTIKLKINERS